MDSKGESVVNLDEEVAEAPVISHNSSAQNLLLAARGVDSVSPAASSSGFASPPDTVAPSKSGDELIKDVIEQLENQCTLRIESAAPKKVDFLPQAAQKPEDQQASLPPASSLFASDASPFATGDFKTANYFDGGDADERRSTAWLPSWKTKEVLSKVPNPDKRLCYTMPGVLVEESMGDPICDLVRKHVGEVEAHRRAAKIRPIADQNEMLRKLIADENFRSAVDLTGDMLKKVGQGYNAAHKHSRNSDETLNLWFIRFKLLLTIGQHNLAFSELEPFGDLDSPDLYYEYYPDIYRGKRGTMVPFGLRLLHAELPRLIGRGVESLARLGRIIDIINQMLRNLNEGKFEDGDGFCTNDVEIQHSRRLWQKRLICAYSTLARCLFAVKEYRSILDVCDKAAALCDEDDEEVACQINGAVGRLCLQLGDLTSATAYFQKVPAHRGGGKTAHLLRTAYCQIFNNNYSEALATFQQILHIEPDNAEAANNAAVCMLYSGRLSDAVAFLESFIGGYPKKGLTENLCTNLCTLYELASARSVQKKIGLLTLINEHRGDGFNPACLKLTV